MGLTYLGKNIYKKFFVCKVCVYIIYSKTVTLTILWTDFVVVVIKLLCGEAEYINMASCIHDQHRFQTILRS